MQIRPIETPADHRAALEEIERLIELGLARPPETASTSSRRWSSSTGLDTSPSSLRTPSTS
jgi:antitoxin component HigA of HigAB toxin-antitoxin module